jgi:hypothetical protein
MTAIELLENELDYALEKLELMARQHCNTSSKDHVEPLLTDSGAIMANALALELLSKDNRFKIVRSFGRVVCGYWPENEPKTDAEEHKK